MKTTRACLNVTENHLNCTPASPFSMHAESISWVVFLPIVYLDVAKSTVRERAAVTVSAMACAFCSRSAPAFFTNYSPARAPALDASFLFRSFATLNHYRATRSVFHGHLLHFPVSTGRMRIADMSRRGLVGKLSRFAEGAEAW